MHWQDSVRRRLFLALVVNIAYIWALGRLYCIGGIGSNTFISTQFIREHKSFLIKYSLAKNRLYRTRPLMTRVKVFFVFRRMINCSFKRNKKDTYPKKKKLFCHQNFYIFDILAPAKVTRLKSTKIPISENFLTKIDSYK
jgi:hypothetical protein